MTRGISMVTMAVVGVLVLAACGSGSTSPLGLSSTEVTADLVEAEASEMPSDDETGARQTSQPQQPSESAGTEPDLPAGGPSPVLPEAVVEPATSDEVPEAQGAPPELDIARSSGRAMSEAAYLSLPAYDITLGNVQPALRDCAAKSGLRDLYGGFPACSLSVRSVNGVSIEVVEACGYPARSSPFASKVCREFAAARTQLPDGRWRGGDGSRRWLLALDSASDVVLEGRIDVVEIDPSTGRELRPVCGVTLDRATTNGPTSCAADTLRPAAGSRAWRITMPGGKVTSGLSSRQIATPAAVVREQNGSTTVTDVSPGLRGRVESGRVLLGSAPVRDWEAAPGTATQPFVELVIDALSSDVTIEGRMRDELTLVAPPGCPETFRVAAGERKVLCRVVDDDRGGVFQVSFPEFVVSKGAKSRDLLGSVVRMGSGAPLQWRSDAATMTVESISSNAKRAVIVPRSASDLGLVAQDPNRVTGTLVVDTSAWTQTYVRFITADVQDGYRAAEGCEEVWVERLRPGAHPLCSFPMRPARIEGGFGMDARRIGLRAFMYGYTPGLSNEQMMSFDIVFRTGVPRSYSLQVQAVRMSDVGFEKPTVTWTSANTFTITVKAKMP
ncbi:MAG: hypothetical protein K9G24_05260 [Candidatus Nanopelagicales bacterium]|nr:hypothetical protein [Candidatus Nanopelagicales bacterium]MCF8536992.1 hypothetical protein [Candidatus Nanopelagicales bacterium]MCF8542475.1 hypothetical protein [Candidatus Nanopelagicales bacterium]